jgi:hypothetical protein
MRTWHAVIVLALSATIASAQVDTVFSSIAAHDGWIQESNEFSGLGSLLENNSSGGSGLRLGDSAKDNQFRSIISFNTNLGSMADCAVIESAVLQLTRGTGQGANPFRTLGQIVVDVHIGGIFDTEWLDLEDFDSDVTFPDAALIEEQGGNLAVHSVDIDPQMINTYGFTQMRLRFQEGDNDNNRADYMGFYAANHSVASRHPRLLIRLTCECGEDVPR